MDIQEKVNLALKKSLEDEGVEMAFPTRTVHLVKES
jgi:small-conductance mechanosensitive channel